MAKRAIFFFLTKIETLIDKIHPSELTADVDDLQLI